MKNLYVLFLLLCFITFNSTVNAQVTEIWTDYNGFWRSSSTSINSIRPDNGHNLLAFRFNGIIYSTNVNNAALNANGVTGYSTLNVRALPVASLPTTGGSTYFVGLGARVDGLPTAVNNSSTAPFNAITTGNQVANFITRGIQGLNLGSCLTNIPSGTSARFNLSSAGITAANVNDGIPDILVSQVAQPAGSNTDRLKFVDANGATVGNIVNVNLSNNTQFPRVGSWNVDFYNFNSTQNNNSFINTNRDLRFFAVDLVSFGINAGNLGNAVALIYEPRGTSDPAFLAFNEPSLGVASRIAIANQPTDTSCDGSLSDVIQIQIEDSNGNAVTQSDLEITAVLESGPGTLSGTLSRLTNSIGIATFNDLEVSAGGDYTIRFQYSSFNDVVSTIISRPLAANCPLPNDVDRDGIVNSIDIDDDNDGITDIVESGGNNPDGDEDGDGTLNYRDTVDNGNGGDGSSTNYADADGNGIPDVYDTDGDGIANHLDLDSDNDGIPDNIEAQSTLGYIAATGGVGSNGLFSSYENNDTQSATGLIPQNTDSQDQPDYLNLDSDNDEIFDINESGSNLVDADNDGKTDGFVGSNGFDNSLEAIDNYASAKGNFDNTQADNFTDTDGDVNTGGDVDYRDRASVIARDDFAIAIVGVTNNNVINVLDNDEFNGGQATTANVIITEISFSNAGVRINTANGNVEVGAGVPSGTYTIEYQICQNGSIVICDTALVTILIDIDTDGDGIIDSVDIDDDNDGIIDDVENSCEQANFVTTPVAFWTLDGNTDDSAGNNDERALGSSPTYSTVSVQGSNSASFNGIDQSIRYSQNGGFMEQAVSLVSFSAWIRPDDLTGVRIIYEEGDSVNGLMLWINNSVLTFSLSEGSVITSSEHPDTLSVDNQWHHVAATFDSGDFVVYLDGVASLTRTISSSVIPAHSNDGGLGGSINGNVAGVSGNYSGLMDAVRYSNTQVWTSGQISTEATLLICDFDNDGVPNSLDLDSDNDGIPDNIEAQTSINYITPNGIVGANGLDSAYESDDSLNATGLTPENTDGTDLPDYLDLDSDNDGAFDVVESGRVEANDGNGRVTGDVGLNGLVNSEEVDDDYIDPNGRFGNDPRNDLTDIDGDVNSGGDLDYRDAFEFTIFMPTQTVFENNAFTSVVPTLDNTPTGNITYSLNGPDLNRFTIDPATGIVSMIARDFENPEDANSNNFYNLSITATSDTGGTADIEFSVIVNNECEDVDVAMNKLSALDAIGDITGDAATVQVFIRDTDGIGVSSIDIEFNIESGVGILGNISGETDTNGFFRTTVTSGQTGLVVISARYDSDNFGGVDTDVELGNPTQVRFFSNINELDTIGEVGIATDTPHPSSVLDVVGTDKGLLVPNVALLSCSDTITIPRPAVSLLVYNTNPSPSLAIGFVFFDGEEWRSICQEKDQIRQ